MKLELIAEKILVMYVEVDKYFLVCNMQILKSFFELSFTSQRVFFGVETMLRLHNPVWGCTFFCDCWFFEFSFISDYKFR